MSEVSDLYSRIAQRFASVLDGCSSDKLDAPSPCEEWKGRDVARHVVHVHRRVLSALDGRDAPEPAPEEDLRVAFKEESQAIADALGDPEKATRTVSGIFGEQPFERLVGRLLCADTLIHTWGFARATGQDEKLDAEGVDKAYEFLLPLDDAIRRPRGFSPRLEPPAGADKQTELLAFVGRRV